jgi:cellulose synthase operon protein C
MISTWKIVTCLLRSSCFGLPLLATQVYAQDSIKFILQNADRLEMPGAGSRGELITGAIVSPLLQQAGADAVAADALQQPMPTAIAPGAQSAATPPKTGPDDIELAALYYYAEQKQDDRVEKEAKRLRLKYPDFTIPQDLYAPQTARGVDETKLWRLYEKNDFTGIDAEIIRQKVERPDWVPTTDFSTKLARKKQRVLMEEAAISKNWLGVIQAGSDINPETETEVDLLWMLIDAYAAVGEKDGMIPVYRGILLRKGDARLPEAALITTLQKCTRDFPASEVQAIMDQVATTTAMRVALGPVSQDLLRRKVADFNADKTNTEPMPVEEIAKLKDVAVREGKPEDLSLLGWYFLKIKQPENATSWFQQALDTENNESNAKGLYLSLVDQKLDSEAYKVAAAHLDQLNKDPEFLMNALSLRFAKPDIGEIDAAVVDAYSTIILQTSAAAHAEILAWYAYNSGQFEASAAWFGKSFDWEPTEASLKGLALSYQQLGQKSDLAALKGQFADQYPELFDSIKIAVAPKTRQAIAVAKPKGNVQASYMSNFNAKNYSACLRDLQSLEAQKALSADTQLIKGWCEMGLHRFTEARQAFAAAMNGNGQTRNDAVYGTALALLAANLTDDAAALLANYPLEAGRDREVRGELYFQKARSAYDNKQYQAALDALNTRASIVAEPVGLSQLRAWAHYNMGHIAEARAIFERLNMHMSDAGISRGLTETSAK